MAFFEARGGRKKKENKAGGTVFTARQENYRLLEPRHVQSLPLCLTQRTFTSTSIITGCESCSMVILWSLHFVTSCLECFSLRVPLYIVPLGKKKQQKNIRRVMTRAASAMPLLDPPSRSTRF